MDSGDVIFLNSAIVFQMGRVPDATVPRQLRVPPRELREGPEQSRARLAARGHRRQLARLIHIPPR